MKEIWSNNYGKKSTEGIQKWLLKNVPNYKRQDLQSYITGFSKYLKQGNKQDSSKLVSNNFIAWTKFVKEEKLGK